MLTFRNFQAVRVTEPVGDVQPGTVGVVVESYPATPGRSEAYLIDFSEPPGEPIVDVLPVHALEPT